jgi:uncharacterized protein YndB with AHSA1/START domain
VAEQSAVVPAGAVQVKRTFTAAREKVFEAWVKPEMMARWFGRGEGMPLSKMIQVDARAGGAYRMDLQSPEGKTYKMHGVYREVRPPERLVFTWQWEGGDFSDSVVTVEFRALGQSNFTEVTLTHEQLPEQWREDHRKGWIGCFDMLEKEMGWKPAQA